MSRCRQAVGFALFGLLVLIVSVNHASAISDAIARGQETAERLCAGCHRLTPGPGRRYLGAYVPTFSEIAKRRYRSPEMLKAFIDTPRHPMPGFLLTPRERDDLVAYIRSTSFP